VQRLDQPFFLLGRYPPEDPVLDRSRVEPAVVEPVQIRSGDQPRLGVEPGLHGERLDGLGVVARDDLEVHTGLCEGRERLVGLGTQLVRDSDKPEWHQTVGVAHPVVPVV
jgi:hypothetical protein